MTNTQRLLATFTATCLGAAPLAPITFGTLETTHAPPLPHVQESAQHSLPDGDESDAIALVEATSQASDAIAGAAPESAQSEAITGNLVSVADESGEEIRVTLPLSDSATLRASDGLAELSDNESSSFVPIVQEDGSLAIHAVLQNAESPTDFEYVVETDSPLFFQVIPDHGGVIALDENGEIKLLVAPPWAVDASGVSLPTHFTIEQNRIGQHVEVNEHTAFPVVADPWLGFNLVSSYTWSYVKGSGWRININPTLVARGYTGSPWYVAIGRAGWDELYKRVPASQRGRLNASGKGQYVCHMGFAGLDPQWNLELWKKARDDWSWVLSKCN